MTRLRHIVVLALLLLSLGGGLAACGDDPVIPPGCGMESDGDIVCPNGQQGGDGDDEDGD